jgi:hypothetical protein
MHGINDQMIPQQIKSSPIDRSHRASSNAGPTVEPPSSIKAELRKFVRRHIPRLKRNHVVAIPVIQPPGIVQQSSLCFHSLIQGRAGKWRDVIKRRDEKTMLDREVDRLRN